MIDCKLLIGVCSCEGEYRRRSAVRKTWASMLPERTELRFFCEEYDTEEKDVVHLKCGARYIDLPGKVMAFYRWAIENSNFEYLAKCDDDTFIIPSRLFNAIHLSDPGMMGYIYHSDDNGDFVQGGLYVMPRKMVQALVDANNIPDEGYEDVLISKEVARLGGKYVDKSDLICNEMRKIPTISNDCISCHHVRPEFMIKLHEAYLRQRNVMTRYHILYR